jgi:hypothetical protein
LISLMYSTTTPASQVIVVLMLGYRSLKNSTLYIEVGGGPCFCESRGQTAAGRHSSQPLRDRTSSGSTAAPTHSRRHACHPAVPIQENRVRNLQSRDKSTTRNTLNREGLTLKSTRSADAAGLAPPAAPRLLWRPAAAVARTTSPFVSGAVPPTTASLWVIAAFGSLGVAGDGGSRDWKLGVTGDGRQENALLRWDRLGGEG